MGHPLVSAHRGGVGDDHAAENTLTAFRHAVERGDDYVEFDVRFTAEGDPVVRHDLVRADGADVVPLAAVVEVLAGGAKAHVDLKEASPGATREIGAVRTVVDALGVDGCVVTSGDDRSVRLVLAWAAQHAPGLRVGVSTGRRPTAPRWRSVVAAEVASWSPRRRIRRTGSTVVVAQHVWARWWLRSWARRRGLPLLVWTVDDARGLTRWMNDDATWLVTTNFPERARAAVRPSTAR